MMDCRHLKELAGAIPPGPWKMSKRGLTISTPVGPLQLRVEKGQFAGAATFGRLRAIFSFIEALSPQNVIALVERLERLEGERPHD